MKSTFNSNWVYLQCSRCPMLFALPKSETPVVRMREVLRGELDRHMQQNHETDLPSEWRAEDNCQ